METRFLSTDVTGTTGGASGAHVVVAVDGSPGPEMDQVVANGARSASTLEHTKDAADVVVGRRSSTVDHLPTGSTTASLAAHSDVPVISVPDGWDPAEQRGLVGAGVDDCNCEEAIDVITAALEEGLRRHARVEIVHAWRPTGAYDAMIGSQVLKDEWSAVTERAPIDLIHVGPARAVLRSATCPVLVVPPRPHSRVET